jgi:hypothetical protein
MPAEELRRELSLNQSSAGRWKELHAGVESERPYGDALTYRKGAAFLKGLAVEDWGCGLGWFRRCFDGPCKGVDGSPSPFADAVVDLCRYQSSTEGLFMRYVLEHNQDWQGILRELGHLLVDEESLTTATRYGVEHIFYLQKN